MEGWRPGPNPVISDPRDRPEDVPGTPPAPTGQGSHRAVSAGHPPRPQPPEPLPFGLALPLDPELEEPR